MNWVDDKMEELRQADRAWQADYEKRVARIEAADKRFKQARSGMTVDQVEALADAAERIAGGG